MVTLFIIEASIEIVFHNVNLNPAFWGLTQADNPDCVMISVAGLLDILKVQQYQIMTSIKFSVFVGCSVYPGYLTGQ
jgi:hypothetical protein